MKKNFFQQAKKVFKNTAFLSLYFLFVYLLAEFIFVKVFLQSLPLRLQGFLPDNFHILAQNSKKGIIPKNYVAILGDSYAVGHGDEFYHADININFLNYGTQGKLYKALHTDIISFGQSGVGSLGGLLAKPINYYRFFNATTFFKMKMPKILLIYFYENDINNNFQELNLRFVRRYGVKKIYDKHVFDDFIRQIILPEDTIYKEILSFHWNDNFILYRFVYNLVRDFQKNSFITKRQDRLRRMTEQAMRMEELNFRPASAKKSLKYKGDEDYENIDYHNVNELESRGTAINQVLVAGEAVSVPDSLHSPALELSKEEIELGAYVFERSLDYLRSFFTGADIAIVYIPSPLSCYELASQKVSIQTYHDRGSIYDAKDVKEKSDFIRKKIKKIAEERKLIFIDPMEKIRSTAQKGIIHGPLDWKHFNEIGYTVLCEAILSELESHKNRLIKYLDK